MLGIYIVIFAMILIKFISNQKFVDTKNLETTTKK